MGNQGVILSQKKTKTAEEKAHMGRVADLGCILCRKLGYGETPAEVHHIRTGTGAGRRASHFDTIGLCPEHHRGNTGLHGLGRKRFEQIYSITELELLDLTNQLLGV